MDVVGGLVVATSRQQMNSFGPAQILSCHPIIVTGAVGHTLMMTRVSCY